MRYSTLFLNLLEKRGLSLDFLSPKYEDLTDPFLLPDMKQAVSRVKRAISDGEKILIYGDYDVDGVTATAIMYETLVLAGVKTENIKMMLPDRFLDGYGMSKKIVQEASSFGASLVITVDCGSNNGEIIEELSGKGIDTVVTDHHEIMGELPKAVAVVNPKRGETLRDLCGAGVAFYLARALALLGLIPNGQEKWLLDLAMIGTICDAMKLTGDNRIICRFGMIVLSKTRRVGLTQLMKVAGTRKIDTDAVGFQIGPRLNAAGRLESAKLALDLLLAKSDVEAMGLAEKLNSLNSERKKKQSEAVLEIEKRGVSDEPVLVVSGAWHEGIIGIVAGKLMEIYKKPAFVLSEGEDFSKGSGRSFGEFNLARALDNCKDYLISGGGHAEACGLKIEKGKLLDFSQAVNEYYRSLGLKNQERFLEEHEDLKVGKLASISLAFMGELELLQPFGEGNPEPKILLEGVRVRFADRIGTDGRHLRLTVVDKEMGQMRLVAFGAEKEWFEIEPDEKISVLITPFVNEWNGVSSVEGRIIKISRA